MHSEPEHDNLWAIGMKTIQELEVDRGILASGKEELYGCVFGRDSLLTSLLLLHVYENTKDTYLLTLVRKVLINLAKLQGRETNPESGEAPGKIIHEFRPDNHEHLTKNLEHPWYLYPDGVMRNYDTVDATPLFLIAAHEYHRLSNDAEILELLNSNVRDAFSWLAENAQLNPQGFITYEFHTDRKYGGLRVQSWMDSTESLFCEEASDEIPPYPIAPVEVQAYAYYAYTLWSEFLKDKDAAFSNDLSERAKNLKKNFNAAFVLPEGSTSLLAFALDGKSHPLTSARSSIGHCLWAGKRKNDRTFDSILDAELVEKVVAQLMAPDMFVPEAGIRTLSSNSTHFEPNSYHNGSIWPHDTALIAGGLAKAGYKKEAEEVRRALMKAYAHFETPIELFIYDESKGGISEYISANGQRACKLQAWSAAGLLATLSDEK